MARRRFSEPSGLLTASDVDAARVKIGSMAANAMKLALEGTTMPYTEMRRACFAPETLRVADAAKEVLSVMNRSITYNLRVPGVKLTLQARSSDNYELSIDEECFCPQPSFANFEKAVIAAAEQYDKFELVYHVLTWMQNNATPGMARYYWPCVKTLAPAKNIPNAIGAFRDNPAIQALLPDIRATSETLAAAALMPDMEFSEPHGYMILAFQRTHPVHGTGTRRDVLI